MHTNPLAQDTQVPAQDIHALFAGKTQAQVQATTSTIIRVWDDSPDTAIVPCTDTDGRRFELVFDGPRKDLFDAHMRPAVDAGGTTLVAEGFWRKRAWRKTRTTGAWGHTWQFIVAAWTHDDQAYGCVPAAMKAATSPDTTTPLD